MPLLGSIGAGSARGFGRGLGKRLIAVDYLVIAGGSTGGKRHGGGGGAGGYRTSFPGGTQIEIESGQTVTVGAGGVHPGSRPTGGAAQGSASSIDSIIDTTRGGVGIGYTAPTTLYPNYFNGGSGGGGGHGGPQGTGGTGNEGGYSPPEGNNGGPAPALHGGGGGGALNNGAGGNPSVAGPGGGAVSSSITGSPVSKAGGGGGGAFAGSSAGAGGGGGATAGTTNSSNSSSATANSGSGSGGTGGGIPAPEDEGIPGNGGSGYVVIRVPSANDPGTLSIAPGTNTISDDGGDKVCVFTVSGSLSF